ncbi:MAG: LysM peptidoglycan-binding domain-containing protein [Actinomycetota bacterium]|nr:LysM peptidoglycan-binding domain-containing protein [Actinomycetota bacterium]
MGDDPSGYEWDYDDQPRKPKILWGRVVALGLFLLLAFLLGRSLGGSGGGGSSEEVARLRADLAEANEKIEELERNAEIEPGPESSPSKSAAATEEYVIKQGDNLAKIAQEYYGDPSLDDCLAAANGIEDPGALRVGETIFIPPDCAE